MQDFRRLTVWRRAHELALGVRRAARSFPRGERGSLKTQMISSAESTVFNIVEGCGASGSKEFARFLDISINRPVSWSTSYSSRLKQSYWWAARVGRWRPKQSKSAVWSVFCGEGSWSRDQDQLETELAHYNSRLLTQDLDPLLVPS